jgi:stage II sporulation protein D
LWDGKLARLPEIFFKHRELIQRGLIILAFGCCFVGCWKKQTYQPVIPAKKPAVKTKDVRVLLYDKIQLCKLTSSAGFSVKDSMMREKEQFPTDGKSLEISVVSGFVKIGERLFGNGCVIEPAYSSLLNINDKPYRGIVKIFTSADGKTFRVINELGIEEYLAGVVGAEMPSYWGAEALKAQTIAARTYCLYTKNRFAANRQWDVKRTQANQVYRGVSAETATVKRAVTLTRSMVLTCKHRDLTTGIFPTYYSSTCGGHTESSYNTFGEYFPPLTGAPCPYCKKTSQSNYLAWGPVKFTDAEITKKVLARYPDLSHLQKIELIEVSKMSEYNRGQGRVATFKLTGKDGKNGYLKGEDLRLTLDPTGKKLKSTYCKITKGSGGYTFTGKGFGHGVGMCQYGAQAMAREGKDYKQILKFYYPTAKIASR